MASARPRTPASAGTPKLFAFSTATTLKHQQTHPEPVDGCFGCKAIAVAFRARIPANKKTTDHTDTAVVTTTEHFTRDQQDVHVALTEPIEMPCKK